MTLPPKPEICILLAHYKGEAFLQAQLDSYLAQTRPGWSLLVSDDGPTPASTRILSDFRDAHPGRDIAVIPGPRQGFSRNFMTLLQKAPADALYVALSDQDDVWFPDKLDRAIRKLEELPADRPGLECARTMLCAAALPVTGPAGLFRRAPDVRIALGQSIGGGNTMVLNRAALELAAAAATEASNPVAHDWWLYQLITGCGGAVIRDEEPVLYYRQHDGNQIGANLSARARMTRLLALLGGRFLRWNTVGLAALEGPSHRFTPQAQQVLADFRAARQGPVWRRVRALRRSGVFRQSRLGDVALYVACLINRL
jgi:glycosyltransferase involved in cell wall biosynthesis